jgi:hypothetical protein
MRRARPTIAFSGSLMEPTTTGLPGTRSGSSTSQSCRTCLSDLIYLLVSLDKQFTTEAPGEPWETYYARQILRHFRPSG